jgi:hypothetical protein
MAFPVPSDRALELTTIHSAADRAMLLNRGDTLYYSSQPSVSASTHDGELADNESVVLSAPTWIRSAGHSLASLFDIDNSVSQAELEEAVTGVSQAEVAEIVKELQIEGLTAEEIEAIVDAKTSSASTSLTLFNVRSYGAKGNASADDYEAVLKTIEAAQTAGGGIVYFPPAEKGKYYKTTKIFKYKFNTPLDFLGHGSLSKIKLTVGAKYGEALFDLVSETEAGEWRQIHRFTNLWIEGPEEFPTAPNKSGTPRGYYPNLTMGFGMHAYAQAVNCKATLFYGGYCLRNFGQVMDDCEDSRCLYGSYRAPNSWRVVFQQQIQGDVQWKRQVSGPLWACVGIHPDYTVESVDLDYFHAIDAPCVFYKEAPQGQALGFLGGWDAKEVGCEGMGNAFMLDEGEQSELHYKGSGQSEATFTNLVERFYPESRLGNRQLLSFTATGGFFKLVIPASKEEQGKTVYAGGTTAKIKYNASNAEIETALNTTVGSESKAFVSTVEGKKQLLLQGEAALLGTNKMTVETGELTGGTASLTEPTMDPSMGPVTQLCTPKKVVVKSATGGTFKLTVKVGETSVTTEAIKYNETAFKTQEILWNAMGHPWGVIVGANSTSSGIGTYYLFFNGRSLGQSIEVTADTASLTGEGATVEISAGTTAAPANRHNDYAFDVGEPKIWIKSRILIMSFGSEGFMRASAFTSSYPSGFLKVDGAGAEEIVSKVEGGLTKAFVGTFSASTSPNALLLTGMAKTYHLHKVTGPVAVGQLVTAEKNYKKYPTLAKAAVPTVGHAGYAMAPVAEGTTAFIPVCTSGVTERVVPYTGTAPAEGERVTPSDETAGAVRKSEALSDVIVGTAVTTGSAGTVAIAPRGCG